MTLASDIQSVQLSEAAVNVARGLHRSALAPLWITCILACIDLPVLTLILWFGQYAAHDTATFAPLRAGVLAGLGALFATTTLALSGGYATADLRRATPSVARAAAIVMIPTLLIAVLTPGLATGDLIFATGLAALAALIPTRAGLAVAAKWVVETGLIERRAVIAGGGDHAQTLIRGLADRPGNDIRLYGIFDDREEVRSPIQVLGVPKIGGYSELISFVRQTEIDMVIIALPLAAQERIDWLMDAFKVLPVEVRLSAYSQDFAFPNTGGDPLLRAMSRSFAPERRLTKRAFDILVASLAILVFSPIMLIAAAAIRLESPGPIIFKQGRHGFNDRVFQVYKFRSMFNDASDPTARKIVTRGDPRVTRVGRFLRRSSIDELPQLFNVLRGELSLVGPRPHAVDALSSGQERFTNIVDGYSARHRLPPGITGWAQINGWRGEIDAPEKLHARFEHDLYYIENWSLWLDIRILCRTPRSLLRSAGAY